MNDSPKHVITAQRFYKWVLERKTGKRPSKKKPPSITKTMEAQAYCRHNWDRYGYKIVARALNHSACTSLSQFESLCYSFSVNPNKK